nr:unnamed protein product [Callosobruchus analis]
MRLEAYKTLATDLQILLAIPVSVASCERALSKVRLIKSYLSLEEKVIKDHVYRVLQIPLFLSVSSKK